MEKIDKIPNNIRNKKIIDGTGGIISVNNLLSYQIGWDNLLINWYESGIKGKIIVMPGEGFDKWDYTGLALHFYKKYSYSNNIDSEINLKLLNSLILKTLMINYPYLVYGNGRC